MEFLKITAITAAAMLAASSATASLPKLDENENPLVAMFVVNGKPEKSFIAKNLAEVRKAGITQFLIYPRSGCEYEYMTDEWFDFVKFLVNQAKEKNFSSVWLYDEFNWPSGTANKQTMKINPDFALTQMSVAAKPDGGYGFEIVKNPQMPDLLNDAPVDCFINLTHENYYKLLKDDFGGLIKGIFTDEPSIGYFVKDKKYLRTISYYDGLEADYRKLTGGDLRADIIAGIRTNSEPYRAPLSKILGERFAKCYTGKIADWCKKHGILATGHLLSEHISSESSKSSGYILSALSALTFPAIDEIRTHENFLNFEWLTFGSGEYAISKNGRGGMAEFFALGPCDMPLSRARRQIWLASAFGVNRYLLAITQTDLRVKISKDPHHEDAFTGWISSFSASQPWFEVFSAFEADAKKAARFAAKERENLVSVVYPYGVSDINDILILLNKAQLSWKLISPEDKPDTKFVLKSENGLPVGFRSFAQAVAAFAKQSPDRPTVTEQNGVLADEIFVRPYKDGSLIIVNFTDNKRNLILTKNGKKYPFTIFEKGVVALEKDEVPQLFNQPQPAPQPNWRVEISEKNTIRPTFKNSNSFAFRLEKPMTITAVVRNYGDAPELELDGSPLVCNAPYDGAILGLSTLYKQADVNLSAGKHVLKLKNNAVDYAYLPSVLLAGNFSESNGVLRPYARDGKGLSGYVGKIAQSAEVKIPQNATSISFDTDHLACELFIDGKSFGAKLFAPFTWEIPQELRGKTAKVKLVRYTSIGRLFGKKANITQKPKGWSRRTFDEFFPQNDRGVIPFAPLSF